MSTGGEREVTTSKSWIVQAVTSPFDASIQTAGNTLKFVSNCITVALSAQNLPGTIFVHSDNYEVIYINRVTHLWEHKRIFYFLISG